MKSKVYCPECGFLHEVAKTPNFCQGCGYKFNASYKAPIQAQAANEDEDEPEEPVEAPRRPVRPAARRPVFYQDDVDVEIKYNRPRGTPIESLAYSPKTGFFRESAPKAQGSKKKRLEEFKREFQKEAGTRGRNTPPPDVGAKL